MSNPFVGEIRMGGWSFAPAGWALCNGASMPVSQYEVLFTLIGTTYGGDGQSNFKLPDLRGRLPLHASSQFAQGAAGGSETVTLTTNQMPTHTHAIIGGTAGTSQKPAGLAPAVAPAGTLVYNAPGNPAAMANLCGNYGGSQPHDNMAPYMAVNFVIALLGIFPARN